MYKTKSKKGNLPPPTPHQRNKNPEMDPGAMDIFESSDEEFKIAIIKMGSEPAENTAN